MIVPREKRFRPGQESYLSSRIEIASHTERVGDVLCRVIKELRTTDPFGAITVITPTLQSAYYLRRSLASTGLFNVNFRRLEDVAEQIAGNTTPGKRLTDIQASEYVYQVALDETFGSRLAVRGIHLSSSRHCILRFDRWSDLISINLKAWQLPIFIRWSW